LLSHVGFDVKLFVAVNNSINQLLAPSSTSYYSLIIDLMYPLSHR
jgi:hypothetical protein